MSTTGLIPVAGIMLILGVDRFLSTMRGLVSLCGQMMASIVVNKWEHCFDDERANAVLSGRAVPGPTKSLKFEQATV